MSSEKKSDEEKSDEKKNGFMKELYDSKKKQLLGRDGAGWGKLGIFYFFFYVGLAGFFCAMLAVFMALTPRDRPRYTLEASRMRTRSNPLTPGLGFRPQPKPDRNLVFVDKDVPPMENIYIKNLDQYLKIYYNQKDESITQKFTIRNPGDCTSHDAYGFLKGKPCVLVKMNKIVDFQPQPGATVEDEQEYRESCPMDTEVIAVRCFGEYPFDKDNIKEINYISENNPGNTNCGSLEATRFPYRGKDDRRDVYQAPYVWVQFNNVTSNVLINVVCRVYGKNIYYDKKTGRALTRFQIFVKDLKNQASSHQDRGI